MASLELGGVLILDQRTEPRQESIMSFSLCQRNGGRPIHLAGNAKFADKNQE
jgi:hypothetical protein